MEKLLSIFLLILGGSLSTFFNLQAQQDLYFEHLDHIDKRYVSNFIPVSEFRSYVWTGNELLDINQDTIKTIYRLAYGTGSNIEFFTNNGDTTFILYNLFDYDVLFNDIIEVKKEGSTFTSTIFSNTPSTYSIVPFEQTEYIIGSFNRLYHFNSTTKTTTLINDKLEGLPILTRNKNHDVFTLLYNRTDENYTIYGLSNLETEVLYHSNGEAKEFEVSNDSIAYILTDKTIEIIDLKTGSLNNSIVLNPEHLADISFSINENFDQFYVSSKNEQTYIDKYNLAGESESLFIEQGLNSSIRKIVVQDSLIYTIGDIASTGHYKVQQDTFVSPTNRRDLALQNLQVFYLGMDTSINIIPTNPPDTIFTIHDLYRYELEVENVGTLDAEIYTTYSNVIRFVPPFQFTENGRIQQSYTDPFTVSQTQNHIHPFITTLDVDFLNIILDGIDNMPDANYSNNSLTDSNFDIVSVHKTLVNQANLTIYPNPVEDKILFQSDTDIFAIQVYNLAGQLRYANTQSSPIIETNLAHLSAGIYYLQMMNKENIPVSVQKIIKL